MQFLGIAKRALAKLYDDMILRAYHPSDEAPIVGVNGNIRARNCSVPAQPYIERFRILRRLICPSVWPLLIQPALQS
jgi:hypothetical protein